MFVCLFLREIVYVNPTLSPVYCYFNLYTSVLYSLNMKAVISFEQSDLSILLKGFFPFYIKGTEYFYFRYTTFKITLVKVHRCFIAPWIV